MAVTGSYWAYGINPKTGLVSKWFWRCESDDDAMGIVATEALAQTELDDHLATHPENAVEEPSEPVEPLPDEKTPSDSGPVE